MGPMACGNLGVGVPLEAIASWVPAAGVGASTRCASRRCSWWRGLSVDRRRCG